MACIAAVDPGSIGQALGIEAGDRLLTMNSRPVADIIDYQYISAEDAFTLEVEKPDGSVLEAAVRREDYDYASLGLCFSELVFGGERRCANNCVFCFIDQLPKGLRDSLYFKDDDYRLSFLQGNFVTLTNVSDAEIQRILDMKLSPLYVSVHAANEAVRRALLGRRTSRPIMPLLRQLASGGIELHTQVVLTPGINDGAVLADTLDRLTSMEPPAASVSVVPVGLTRHRGALAQLAPVAPHEAAEVIEEVRRRAAAGRRVYAADEFYFLADAAMPPDEAYDDYPQLENGIGLTRLFIDDFARLESNLPARFQTPVRLIVATGALGARAIGPACDRLKQIEGLEVELLPVPNRLFGPGVTVTGLVVGQDIAEAVRALRSKRAEEHDIVLIPDVMLRRGGDVFLDDLTPDELERALGIPLMLTETSAEGLVDAVSELSCGVISQNA